MESTESTAARDIVQAFNRQNDSFVFHVQMNKWIKNIQKIQKVEYKQSGNNEKIKNTEKYGIYEKFQKDHKSIVKNWCKKYGKIGFPVFVNKMK